MLAQSIALRVQVFAGRHAQTIQGRGGVHPHPLSQCDAFKHLEPLTAVTLEQGLRIGELKRLDHVQ